DYYCLLWDSSYDHHVLF
nr:immunoglobulin light chain junction region [Macaca mulatta]MOX78850.1 immunoglobulin light chain junction region [Macaca mulatta]MOX80179.1 immunoglobulin light chain junction region [Macaca mulatta]MOX80670.1 immunoglobulin light chain junction region [Macaca mulatta]MOX81363.1 immunoglobulin light chain junction region [Macaca mulatta]